MPHFVSLVERKPCPSGFEQDSAGSVVAVMAPLSAMKATGTVLQLFTCRAIVPSFLTFSVSRKQVAEALQNMSRCIPVDGRTGDAVSY